MCQMRRNQTHLHVRKLRTPDPCNARRAKRFGVIHPTAQPFQIFFSEMSFNCFCGGFSDVICLAVCDLCLGVLVQFTRMSELYDASLVLLLYR